MQRWLLLIFLFFYYFAAAQEQGYPIIHNYTPETYNQSPQVFCATQDIRGWMYFGINGNVMQYDGGAWRLTPIPNQSSIYSIVQAVDSTVYVGATGDLGYLKEENQLMVYQSLSHLIPEKDFKFTSIWQALEHRGDIYFRCFEAIIRYRPKPKPSIKIFHRNKGKFLGGMVQHGEHLYVYHHGTGLQEITEEGFENLPQTEFFADKRFYTGCRYSPDSLLIVARNKGLYLMQPSSNASPKRFQYRETDFFEDNDIYAMSHLDNELLCLLSIKKGALVMDKQGKVVQRLNQNTFMQSNYTRQVYAQKYNLWITSNTGIDKVDADFDLSYWDKHSGLNDLVEAIVRHNGKIYVGTHNGTYCLIDNQPVRVQGMPAGQTWALGSFTHNNGKETLLAATSKGVFSIEGLQAKALTKSQGHESANILYQSRKYPKCLYSTQGKHLLRMSYENGEWKPETVYTGLLEDIRGIAEDKEGNLWLGSFRNGVIRVSIDQMTQKIAGHQYYTLDDGFASLKDIIPFNYQDTVIFGTEHGFYSYNASKDSFEPYCDLGEAFCGKERDVFSFKEMPNGKIWILPLMTQYQNIGYLEQKGGNWVFEPFTRIPKMMMRAFYAEANGVTWFGGEKGLYRYDSRKDNRNYQKPFPVYIQQMWIGKDSLVYDGTTLSKSTAHLSEIPYRYNTVKISFAAPFFEQEAQTMYRYRLVGAGEQWSDWTKQTLKEYNYLTEGDYIFEVKARNVYGVESEIAQLQFSLLPPLHRTIWAYAIYAIALAFIIWGLIKYNTYRLTREKEILEGIIEKRTAEITHQKDVLEVQKEEILLKNSEIMQQKEEIESQADNLREANRYISLQKDEVEKHLKHLSTIVQIGQEITASLNLDNIIDKVYQHVNSLMEAHEFGIGFYDEQKQKINFKLLVLDGQRLYGHNYKINDQRLSSVVVANKKPIWLQNIKEEYKAYLPSLEAYKEGDLLSSVICIPLMVEKRVIGVMSVQSIRPDAYSSYHFDLLQALSAYVAVALDNSNAYQQIHQTNLQLEDKVKQRTEQIKKAFDELLNAHEQLDDLTYRSAHDLRGPIARLEGLCHIAKLELSNHEIGKAYINKISEEAAQMDALLNRIMLTQSVKTKEVKPSPVFVDNLIEDILKCYTKEATDNGIQVSFNCKQPIRIFSDYTLVEHLIGSVIDNAFKFYKESSIDSFVKVIARDLPNQIEIRVIDNGIGILQESRNRVFEMFFVSHEDRRGHGLGLFDARVIADKLKGSITLAEREDKLTEFVIKLPKKAVFLHWTQMIS